MSQPRPVYASHPPPRAVAPTSGSYSLVSPAGVDVVDVVVAPRRPSTPPPVSGTHRAALRSPEPQPPLDSVPPAGATSWSRGSIPPPAPCTAPGPPPDREGGPPATQRSRLGL